MGRPRTPTETKKTAGTYRACRANPAEPKYAPGEPPLPAALGPAAVAVWREVVPLLLAQKLLAPVDGGALGAYCTAVAGYLTCCEVLANLLAQGLVIDGGFYQASESGLWKEHPVVKAQREWLPLVDRFAKQLGLSPASRAGVTPVAAADDEDELSKLMRETTH